MKKMDAGLYLDFYRLKKQANLISEKASRKLKRVNFLN